MESIVQQIISGDLTSLSELDYAGTAKTAAKTSMMWIIPAILFFLAGIFMIPFYCCRCCCCCCCPDCCCSCTPNKEKPYPQWKKNSTAIFLAAFIAVAIVGIGLGCLISANMKSLVNDGLVGAGNAIITDGISTAEGLGTVANHLVDETDTLLDKIFSIITGVFKSIDPVLITPWSAGAGSTSSQLDPIFQVIGGVFSALVTGSGNFGDFFAGLENPMFSLVGSGGIIEMFTMVQKALQTPIDMIDTNAGKLCIQKVMYSLANSMKIEIAGLTDECTDSSISFYTIFAAVGDAYDETSADYDAEFKSAVDGLTTTTGTTWASNLATTLNTFFNIIVADGNPLMTQLKIGTDYITTVTEAVVEDKVVTQLEDAGVVDVDGKADIMAFIEEQYADMDLGLPSIGPIKFDTAAEAIDSVALGLDLLIMLHIILFLPAIFSLCCRCSSCCSRCCTCLTMCCSIWSFLFYFLYAILFITVTTGFKESCSIFDLITESDSSLRTNFPDFLNNVQTVFDMNISVIDDEAKIDVGTIFSDALGENASWLPQDALDYKFDLSQVKFGEFFGCSGNYTLLEALNIWEFLGFFIGSDADIPNDILTDSSITQTIIDMIGDTIPQAIYDMGDSMTDILDMIGSLLGGLSLSSFFESTISSAVSAFDAGLSGLADVVDNATQNSLPQEGDGSGIIEYIILQGDTDLVDVIDTLRLRLDTDETNSLRADYIANYSIAGLGGSDKVPTTTEVLWNGFGLGEVYAILTELEGGGYTSDTNVKLKLYPACEYADDTSVHYITWWGSALGDICDAFTASSVTDAISFIDTLRDAVNSNDGATPPVYDYVAQPFDADYNSQNGNFASYCDTTCAGSIADDLLYLLDETQFKADASSTISSFDPLLTVISTDYETIGDALSPGGAFETITLNQDSVGTSLRTTLGTAWTNVEEAVRSLLSWFIYFFDTEFLSCSADTENYPVALFDTFSTVMHDVTNIFCGYFPNIFLSAALCFNFLLIAQVCIFYTAHTASNRWRDLKGQEEEPNEYDVNGVLATMPAMTIMPQTMLAAPGQPMHLARVNTGW
eukprot:gnl/Carplike_NY0171/309_a427_3311.p1 GENE.gnl/Carplike_NY0171/309_a427_3311~~gnl/Carplike_NY0171/309_a427_3311.p1  ORF type:complete len:1064 (+),score=341.99 gnl/Carplike_NY0171/309_a427_3311:112-3303(+)